ncbi:hypothetical protein ABH942_002570 [Flavobacterium sp. 28YEA47A]|uniref:T9SS type A sorting domain-containing protein n=1 Tax=Flavobacterium sp. 28YEA47A TaxID=3156276 RepID=UPI0035144F5A
MKKITFYLIALILLSYQAYAQAPPNDDCSGAINLNVNTDLSCTLKSSGTLMGATRSNVISGMQGFIPNNDVWYAFTATAANHKISLKNVQGSTTPLVIEVFAGTCGQLNSITFSPDSSLFLSNLTIGATFYVRVFTMRAPSPTTFEICISTPSVITNDECSTAIGLTVNPDLNCVAMTSGHLMGATSSGSFGNLPARNDVWYSFTATMPNHRISLLNYDINEPVLAFQLFEGNCGELTSKFVAFAYQNTGSRDAINLIPGTTYYIRVFSSLPDPIATTFDICIQTFPIPNNDECANAIALSVNTDESCTLKTSGTVAGATPSQESSTISGIPNDVWYSFTATATSHKIVLQNVTGPYEDAVKFEVMQGNCGQLQSIHSSQSATISSLIIGTTYYIRVFSNPVYDVRTSTFDICIGIPLPPPVNDDCINAITLAVNPDSSCTQKSAGTIANATDSNEGGNPMGTPDDDVWYKFVATATSHIINLLDVEGYPVLIHEVMEGTCGGGQMAGLQTSDKLSSKISGLTIGNTYYIRVFSSYQNINFNTTFNICVKVPPPPPANDNCENAISLAVNPNATCVQTVSGTIAGATDSQVSSNEIDTPDDDVWYTFIATATSHKIKLLNVTGEQTDLILEVMQGSCGGQLTSIRSSNRYENLVSNLIVGNTYYIRVFSSAIGSTGSSSFDICVTTEQRPQNDNCADAIALTINIDLSCTLKATGTLTNATNEIDNEFERPDVWYSFTATAPYHEVKINSSDFSCWIYSYNGDCQTNRSLVTSQTSPEGNIIPFGLTVGNTYLIRVITYMESPPETFEICVGTFPPPPVNDNCSDAITLEVAANLENGIINSTNVGATDFYYFPLPDCAPYNRGDVWFKAVMPSNGELNIQTGDPENSTSSPFDSGLAAYYGNCEDGLELIACNDNISPTEVNSKITLTDRIPGEEIFIRVWEIGNDEQKPFTISAWSNSLTTPEFKANSFKAYPNPVRNRLNLSYDQIIANVKVYNVLGQAIVSKEINDRKGSIDLSDLPAGPYLVQITSSGISKSMTIVKQ